MDIDLESFSLKELKELQTQVGRAVATFVDRKKKNALVELEEKAREMGFSLAELTGASVPRKRTAATTKYANPENSDETWSGRGRKPRWFDSALKTGLKPDDMML